MEKQELIALLEKYKDNRCSPEEATRLLRHIQSGKDRDTVEAYMTEQVFADPANGASTIPGIRESLARVYEQVQRHKHEKTTNTRPTVRRIATLAATAAAVLLFFSIGIYWYTTTRQQPAPGQILSQHANDVLPGGNRATLTLDDGQHIALSEAHEGIIFDETLRYQDGTSVGELDLQAVEYARLATPRGGQYQVTLPDGSKVWLNAGSSLRYPTRFAGAERLVELEGEAYFEVTEDVRQPFIVRSSGQEVEVLGTSFNVNAYQNEPAVLTTLISGKVALRIDDHPSPLFLVPNEQAFVRDGTPMVRQVDAANHIAWKNGLIVLSRMDLPTVLRQLERWYDVEFVGTAHLDVTGTMSGQLQKDLKLSEILQVLSSYTHVSFKIEGGKVIMN